MTGWLLFVVEQSRFKAQTETKPEVVEAVQYCGFKTDQLTHYRPIVPTEPTWKILGGNFSHKF